MYCKADMQSTKMCAPVKQKKKTTGVLNSSSPRSINNSVSGVPSSILVGGRNSIVKRLERGHNRTPRKTARMLGSDGKEITPLAMFQAELGIMPSSAGRFFLGETFFSSGSDHMKSTSSFTVHSSSSFVGSSLPSNLSAIASLTNESEDSSKKLDIPINPPAPCEVLKERDIIEQTLTEVMLDEVAEICLTETDTISLLDIPSSIFVTEDADDAGAIKEKNNQYAELCKNRIGNDNYFEESAQTFSGAPKDKHTQSDKIAKKDKGMIATSWDIYDSFCDQNKSPDTDKDDYTESTVGTCKGQESGEKSGSSSSSYTDSTRGSQYELEMCGSSLNTEPDPQLILSESFQHSLFVMERIIAGKIFQPKLAAYRQLPMLEDPDNIVKPGTEEQSEEGEKSSSPTLEYLWAFSCELTKGRKITSMAWNKINSDILAVAYSDCDPSNYKPSLICCWSLKNPMWPERVFHCDSWVTSLDFSAINPSQLAVGMYNGTIAIYNVQRPNNNACITDSSKCSERHLHPVWHVNWIKEDTLFLREGGAEALISVSADGRITRWSLHNNDLDCRDLMELKSNQHTKKKKKKAAGAKTKTECFLLVLTRGLCLDIHPTDSCIYLVGTSEGLIHKCSLSNSQNVLDTYQKDLCPVNHIKWSPFSSDVFLSCSSDQIHLWKQNHFTPVFSFTSTQEVVKTVSWSPNWPEIFAAIIGGQVEIWDLDSNILAPTIVHRAASGVKLTSLLFTTGTDCVLVGDSDGQVTVYQLKNLSVGKCKKVNTLDYIIQHI